MPAATALFLNIREVIKYMWLALAAVWILGAVFAKRTVRSQSSASRALNFVFVFIAWLIGFSRLFRFGLFTMCFVPASPAIAYTSLAIVIAGLAFTLWARVILGSNWSGRVTVKQDHVLIRRGPYAIVRHPIYSGILLALLGTNMAFREIRGLLSTAVVVVMLIFKFHIEEKFMMEQFGAEYAEYKRQVKSLIPFIL